MCERSVKQTYSHERGVTDQTQRTSTSTVTLPRSSIDDSPGIARGAQTAQEKEGVGCEEERWPIRLVACAPND